MYTQCACCVHAWVDIPTYRDMRGCALCILGCREQTNVFLFILLAGRIGPDELVSSSNSTFFPLPSVFLPPPTTNESDPTRIPTSRFIDDDDDDDETRSSLDCFFFLRGSIYPVESDSLQFPKRSQRNGAWNSIAVHAIFNVSPNRFTRKNVQTAII